MVREEYNLPLTKEAYDHLVQKIDGRLIEKTRYLIPLDGGLTAELDVFEGDLAPLTLVEVEFDSVDAANEFTAPDRFCNGPSGTTTSITTAMSSIRRSVMISLIEISILYFSSKVSASRNSSKRGSGAWPSSASGAGS